MLPIHQIDVLLVQDPSERESLLKAAFEANELVNIGTVVDCRSVLTALRTCHDQDLPLPNLILVNQSRNGHAPDDPSLSNELELLAEIKSHRDFRSIPVVIFTNSREATAVLNAYSHGACSFVCKPEADADMHVLVERFARYWSQVVQLPKSHLTSTPSLSTSRICVDERELEFVQPVEILVVDDSDNDVLLLKEAFAGNRLVRFVHTVESGEDALNYLRREVPYGNARRPGLVLIDINMPKQNGFDVLAEIRRDPQLSKVPVVMFTTSQQESDILRAYSDGACSFISKPVNFDHMREIAQHFALYWSLVADVPHD